MFFLYVSTAAQYFASTMMIVGMSVVVTVIVLQFHHHDPHGGKMPKWVSYSFNQTFIPMVINNTAQVPMFI